MDVIGRDPARSSETLNAAIRHRSLRVVTGASEAKGKDLSMTPTTSGRVVVRRFVEADLPDFLAYQGHPAVREHQPGDAMTRRRQEPSSPSRPGRTPTSVMRGTAGSSSTPLTGG